MANFVFFFDRFADLVIAICHTQVSHRIILVHQALNEWKTNGITIYCHQLEKGPSFLFKEISNFNQVDVFAIENISI